MRATERQEILDSFYFQHGPCCAGCDWWRHVNGIVGECQKSPPVSGSERWAMTDLRSCSLHAEAGHVMTPRHHFCGSFKDDFDWSSLPLSYRRRVGDPSVVQNGTKTESVVGSVVAEGGATLMG